MERRERCPPFSPVRSRHDMNADGTVQFRQTAALLAVGMGAGAPPANDRGILGGDRATQVRTHGCTVFPSVNRTTEPKERTRERDRNEERTGPDEWASSPWGRERAVPEGERAAQSEQKQGVLERRTFVPLTAGLPYPTDRMRGRVDRRTHGRLLFGETSAAAPEK